MLKVSCGFCRRAEFTFSLCCMYCADVDDVEASSYLWITGHDPAAHYFPDKAVY